MHNSYIICKKNKKTKSIIFSVLKTKITNSIKFYPFFLHSCATEGKSIRICLQIVNLLAERSLQLGKELLIEPFIAHLCPQHPACCRSLGVSAEEVLVKLLQDLFVGHQGLDELFLISSCETVEGYLTELLKR